VSNRLAQQLGKVFAPVIPKGGPSQKLDPQSWQGDEKVNRDKTGE
jgi:hypothetical protein